jgi:hypothetical protein
MCHSLIFLKVTIDFVYRCRIGNLCKSYILCKICTLTFRRRAAMVITVYAYTENSQVSSNHDTQNLLVRRLKTGFDPDLFVRHFY